MARKKIREYDSKRLLREHLKRLAGIDLQILSAQVSTSPPSLSFASDRLAISGRIISGAGWWISAGGADRDPAAAVCFGETDGSLDRSGAIPA
jgi:hypothetical protein